MSFSLLEMTSAAGRIKSHCWISAIALLCLIPHLAMAQTALPTLWRYNPISSVVDAVYSPDGSLIAVAGNGGVQIYSVSTGALIQDLSGNLNENNMAFSPDGKTVAVASGPVQVWDVATGTLIETLVAGNAEFGIGIQTWVTFSPDGTTLAACSLSTDSFGLVTTWNVATGVQTRLSATSGNYFLDGIAYSPDGSKLAICGGGYVPVLQILDATTGFEVASFSSSATTVLSLAYSPDGKSLAAGGTRVNTGNNPTSGVLELWDVSSGQLIKSLPTASSSVNSVAFSPDGTLLADGTTSAGLVTGDAELWNVKSGSLAKTLDSPSKSVVTSVAFSPGGKSIVSSGQDYRSATRLLSEVDIWNVPSAALTTAILPAIFSPTGIAYSSDGSTFASWGTRVNTAAKTIDNWVGILNPSTGKVTSSFTPDGVVTSAAFSANGSILATGGY